MRGALGELRAEALEGADGAVPALHCCLGRGGAQEGGFATRGLHTPGSAEHKERGADREPAREGGEKPGGH